MKQKTKIRVRCTPTSLQKVGVEILDVAGLRLRCKSCKKAWSPNLLSGGRLPRNWWKCPNGCNEN